MAFHTEIQLLESCFLSLDNHSYAYKQANKFQFAGFLPNISLINARA